MNTLVLGFVAVFLVVFLVIFAVSRRSTRTAQVKQDEKTWEEGLRRREQANDDAAWQANKKMPMK